MKENDSKAVYGVLLLARAAEYSERSDRRGPGESVPGKTSTAPEVRNSPSGQQALACLKETEREQKAWLCSSGIMLVESLVSHLFMEEIRSRHLTLSEVVWISCTKRLFLYTKSTMNTKWCTKTADLFTKY